MRLLCRGSSACSEKDAYKFCSHKIMIIVSIILQLHSIAEVAVAGVVGIDDHLFEHYLWVNHDDAEGVLAGCSIDFGSEPTLIVEHLIIDLIDY